MSAPERLYLRLPMAPSVNAIYTVNRHGEVVYTRAARAWKKSARDVCRLQAYQQGWSPLEKWTRVVFLPYFGDRMTHDVTNLHKLVCDALTSVVYVDDVWALAHDGRPGFDREYPRLELLIYPDTEDLETVSGVSENADALCDFRETLACRDLFRTPSAAQLKACRSRRR